MANANYTLAAKTTASAQATADALVVQYDEAYTATLSLVPTYNVPWVQFLAAKAAAAADWAEEEAGGLAEYTNDLAQAEKTWTHSVATARIARLEALTLADQQLAEDLNAAAWALAVEQINADEQFVNTMAAARTEHATTVSNKARDYAVAVGQARAARPLIRGFSGARNLP